MTPSGVTRSTGHCSKAGGPCWLIMTKPSVRAGKEELVKRAREMMTNDYEFIRAISGSTGDVRNVRTRLRSVRDAAQEVLG